MCYKKLIVVGKDGFGYVVRYEVRLMVIKIYVFFWGRMILIWLFCKCDFSVVGGSLLVKSVVICVMLLILIVVEV